MDTQHSGKHRHPLLKPGQKYRAVGGFRGQGRDLKRSLVKARPTPKQGQGAQMGFCTDACRCTLCRLSEHMIKGESI